MVWQNNMFQTKEQDKTPEERLSDVEISNPPKKEFRVIIIKMIQKLWKRMNAQEIPWQSSGWDSAFSLLRVRVQSLVRKRRSQKPHGKKKEWMQRSIQDQPKEEHTKTHSNQIQIDTNYR